MAVKLIQCGQPANASERLAAQRCRAALEALGDTAPWVIFANLASSSSPLHQSDDLDLVLIGPRGVFLPEVKHWDAAWISDNQMRAEDEAEKLTVKTRRFAGRVQRALFKGPKVQQSILLTREPAGQGLSPSLRGVPLWTLRELPRILRALPGGVLSETQINSLAASIQPAAKVQLDGKVRRIAAYQNLELQTLPTETFHRIYKGVHHRTKERVILHLYDLSATEQKNPERQAERESRALQMLQQTRFVPRVRDTLRDLPEYPGELSYFTLIDPGAPTIAARASDQSWPTQDRLAFSAACLDALKSIHTLADAETGVIVHRNICPGTILVGSRNEPLFADFSLARLPNTQTLGTDRTPDSEYDAPEVRRGGLAAATQSSDVYSLCASLLSLFKGDPSKLANAARLILEFGRTDSAEERASLPDLRERISGLLAPTPPPQALFQFPSEPELPPSEYWCEGQLVPFRDMTLRVVSRLGAGGVGRTFKVEQVDPVSGENFGTFVAKVMKSPESGRAALQAYQRVRSHSATTGLSTVFETASEFHENRVVALMKWVEGDSLDSLAGVLSLAAEEAGDESVEALLSRWALEVCNSLAVLHSQGLVHGDVSPRNLIHHRGGLTLTDYDLVTTIGHPSWGVGAVFYCSPEAQRREPLQPSDDVFALAAALFEVAFDRNTFSSPRGAIDKSHGLDWRLGDRDSLPKLADFLDRATQADPQRRFKDAQEACAFLRTLAKPAEEETSAVPAAPEAVLIQRTNQQVTWLNSLLQIYPGSPHGNSETRGLDSEFAVATYVQTPLEEALFGSLQSRQTRLVILCGNAGDGKTALLQHLAAKFGVSNPQSATRIWEATTSDGLVLRANLDGAAAWKERTANDLMDEFLQPFANGLPDGDIAHLLAINDGRLYEWIETRERTSGPSALTRWLRSFLAHDDEGDDPPAHVQFISLNHRSLVGGRTPAGTWSSDFLDRLIHSLLGGSRAKSIWSPCVTCTAWDRCVAGPTAHRLLADSATPQGQLGQRLRQRLAEALQAVHQRGQVHITTRELRGVLSYVLFGVLSCSDLHDDPGRRSLPLWDMIFDPNSPHRQPPQQGVLLHELSSLDPALEAHPQLDRWLMGRTAREVPGAGTAYPGLARESARRRAYTEWSEDQVEAVTGTREALTLASGEHLKLFREAALRDPADNSDLCGQLCRGISQLESLPPLALARPGIVPLRITPRTPTESSFWVEKPIDRFRLEAEWPRVQNVPMPILPRQLRLVYHGVNGHEDVLFMGYELFHTLLSLASGEQLSELRSDDLFANLTIFTQRLVQEDEGHLLAWNPKTDDTVFRLAIRRSGTSQVLTCEPTSPDQGSRLQNRTSL
jgi:serine/threonine protein kinase